MILFFYFYIMAISSQFIYQFSSTTEQDVGLGIRDLNYVKIKDHFYYSEQDIKSNHFILTQLKDTTARIILAIPDIKLYYPLQSYKIRNIAFAEEKLAIVLNNYIIAYYMQDDFKTYKIFDLEQIFQNVENVRVSNNFYIQKNRIFGMYDFYDANINEKEDYHFWYFDIDNVKNNKFISFPPPKAFFYTIFQPRSIIDYSNGRILTTDILNYKMYIRDIEGNIRDSIIRDIPDWTTPKINDETKVEDPRLLIREIQSDTTQISLIHRADFLTQKRILVTYSMENRRESGDPYLYNLLYDIWEESDGNWTLIEKEVSINSLQKNNYMLPDLFFGMNYQILDNYFISTYFNRDTYSDFRIIVRKIE